MTPREFESRLTAATTCGRRVLWAQANCGVCSNAREHDINELCSLFGVVSSVYFGHVPSPLSSCLLSLHFDVIDYFPLFHRKQVMDVTSSFAAKVATSSRFWQMGYMTPNSDFLFFFPLKMDGLSTVFVIHVDITVFVIHVDMSLSSHDNIINDNVHFCL